MQNQGICPYVDRLSENLDYEPWMMPSTKFKSELLKEDLESEPWMMFATKLKSEILTEDLDSELLDDALRPLRN